ncbi:MAG: hypothetical protein R3A46_09360 [Thermomicrobiales bacterium]
MYPDDRESLAHAQPDLAARIISFCAGSEERNDGSIRPASAIEIRREIDAQLWTTFEQKLVEGIVKLNAGFRESFSEYPVAAKARVPLYPDGSRPFALDAGRIRQRRILTPGS